MRMIVIVSSTENREVSCGMVTNPCRAEEVDISSLQISAVK